MSETTSPILAGMWMRCPRCGLASVFKSFLTLHDTCPNCELSLKEHDAGDGPVYAAIFVVGIVITALASIIEIKYEPPLWLQAVVWIPLTFLAAIVLLRLFKSLFIAMQYKYNVGGFRDETK